MNQHSAYYWILVEYYIISYLNLGTFWLKIKQFWPFEEISIFSNGGHLGWRAWLSDITFKGNPLRMIQAKFGSNWPSGFRGEDF